MTYQPLRIAFLGLGMMGLPMAQRLCQAGYRVHAWNRTAAKALPLQHSGAHLYAKAAEAVQTADIVISMLAHGDAVEDVLRSQGAAQAVPHGALWMDMSSIAPQQARAHAAYLQAHDIAYLDAPVSGGTVGAQEGSLAIMVGGEASDFARAAPVFSVLGRATHIGPHGTGQLTKLANQMIVGITIGAVAEALLFTAKGGADMGQVRQAITGGFADSRILQLHGQRMVERDFTPRARMGVQHKDLHNALTTAQELGFDAPITRQLQQLYTDAIAHGMENLDHSGLFMELAQRNAMS